MGTLNTSKLPLSASRVDARHRARPVISGMSADLVTFMLRNPGLSPSVLYSQGCEPKTESRLFRPLISLF